MFTPTSARPADAHPSTSASSLTAALVGSLLLCLAPSAGAAPESSSEPVELSEELLPLPLSDAERRGVEIVLAYLEEGPSAVYNALATESPLRSLGRSAALGEIEVRMGPPEGSTWTLRTPGQAEQERGRTAIFGVEMASSLDDTIHFEMVDQRGVWQLWELRCGVDFRSSKTSSPDLLDLLGDGSLPVPGSFSPAAPIPTLALAILAILWGIASLTLWRRPPVRGRRRRLPAAALALTLVSAGVLSGCDWLETLRDQDEVAKVSDEEDPPPTPLARLLPLRRALAGATEGITPSDLKSMVTEQIVGLGPDHPVALAARAWNAQTLLHEGHLSEAENLLLMLPDPTTMPTVALLRARFAHARADAEATESHFEDLRHLEPLHDGLLMESARAFAFFGSEIMFDKEMDRLVFSQSREAWPFYTAAKMAVIEDRMERAEVLFHAAWKRQPIPRQQLFADSLLAHVATRPRVFPLFDFADHQEPALGPTGDEARSRPLALPEGTEATVLGEHLVLELPTGSIFEIPGAGRLVPETAEVLSAADRARADALRAYGDLDQLIAEVETRGLANPARRQRAVVAAQSLMAEGHWEDILALTRSIAEAPEEAPTDLVKARASALLRLERTTEATNLLIRVAQSDLANKRSDPSTFYLLGEMLAALEQYDLSLRAFDRAQSSTRIDITRQRKAQIKLDQDLAESPRTFESEHFRLVYPASTQKDYPRRLSWVLEAEWKRLQHWIPVGRLDEKVEVHLYPLREFLRAYSSNVLVLGIFDGKLRVPLADLASFHPELVQIVSHELAHAMIDVATDGNSPRWLHEGLASHVEMRQRGVNPIPDLHDAGRDLSFTLIEPILDGFGEAQLVELAYSHATWALHYIEAKHGVRTIHRLLDAFERGHDTAGALRRTVGMTPERFDQAVRTWSIDEAPQVWPSRLVKYHELFDDIIDREDLGMMVMDPSEIETEVAHRAPSKAQMPARMKSWHRLYTARVMPVKKSLSHAMPLLRGQAEGNVQAACVDLERKVRSLIRDGDALASPDPQAARELSRAYRAFFHVAQECRKGEWNLMRNEMHKAMNALGRANEALEPHGLAP